METRTQGLFEQSGRLRRSGFAAIADKASMRRRRDSTIAIDGVELLADLSGALFWPDEGVLVAADLHLEKGSAYAARGLLLPPYDTASTLDRLASVIAFYDPRVVIALGDSFHDSRGAARLGEEDRRTLVSLQHGRDWLWIAGNHDPVPASGLGGEFVQSIAFGRLQFRHEPSAKPCAGEIAGHLHPSARISRRGRTLIRRCFAGDGERLILPAFGAYAGGLNIRDSAFFEVFRTLAFTAHLIGDRAIYALPASRCLGW
jgi:DNA ligase-associated metallophosphoesterase